MRQNWKRNGSLALCSLLLCSSLVHADNESSQMRSLENRVTALEQKKGASGVINPSAAPRVRNGADLALHADLLYWQSHVNGLPIAVEQKEVESYVDVNGTQVQIYEQKVVHVHPRWDFGFRLGVDYRVPHDGWDIDLSWLRFHNRAQMHHHLNTEPTDITFPSQTFYPVQTDAGLNQGQSALARTKLNLNQLDLSLGRNFFVSKWLSLRPHVGLRSDWIWQKVEAEYTQVSVTAADGRNFSRIHEKNKFWGLGACAGCDTEWGLGEGWSIYGNGAISLLYGYQRASFGAKHQLYVAYQDTPKSFERLTRAITDLELGLSWGHMFCRDQFHLQIQGGWEHHLYFGMNPSTVFTTDDQNRYKSWQNQGDLSIQGWTLSARFDF